MYVKIRAKTGMKAEKVHPVSKTHLEISVKEKPLQNLANKRLVELVALHFGVPKGKVRIVSGHHSPSKIFSVDVKE